MQPAFCTTQKLRPLELHGISTAGVLCLQQAALATQLAPHRCTSLTSSAHNARHRALSVASAVHTTPSAPACKQCKRRSTPVARHGICVLRCKLQQHTSMSQTEPRCTAVLPICDIRVRSRTELCWRVPAVDCPGRQPAAYTTSPRVMPDAAASQASPETDNQVSDCMRELGQPAIPRSIGVLCLRLLRRATLHQPISVATRAALQYVRQGPSDWCGHGDNLPGSTAPLTL